MKFPHPMSKFNKTEFPKIELLRAESSLLQLEQVPGYIIQKFQSLSKNIANNLRQFVDSAKSLQVICSLEELEQSYAGTCDEKHIISNYLNLNYSSELKQEIQKFVLSFSDQLIQQSKKYQFIEPSQCIQYETEFIIYTNNQFQVDRLNSFLLMSVYSNILDIDNLYDQALILKQKGQKIELPKTPKSLMQSAKKSLDFKSEKTTSKLVEVADDQDDQNKVPVQTDKKNISLNKGKLDQKQKSTNSENNNPAIVQQDNSQSAKNNKQQVNQQINKLKDNKASINSTKQDKVQAVIENKNDDQPSGNKQDEVNLNLQQAEESKFLGKQSTQNQKENLKMNDEGPKGSKKLNVIQDQIKDNEDTHLQNQAKTAMFNPMLQNQEPDNQTQPLTTVVPPPNIKLLNLKKLHEESKKMAHEQAQQENQSIQDLLELAKKKEQKDTLEKKKKLSLKDAQHSSVMANKMILQNQHFEDNDEADNLYEDSNKQNTNKLEVQRLQIYTADKDKIQDENSAQHNPNFKYLSKQSQIRRLLESESDDDVKQNKVQRDVARQAASSVPQISVNQQLQLAESQVIPVQVAKEARVQNNNLPNAIKDQGTKILKPQKVQMKEPKMPHKNQDSEELSVQTAQKLNRIQQTQVQDDQKEADQLDNQMSQINFEIIEQEPQLQQVEKVIHDSILQTSNIDAQKVKIQQQQSSLETNTINELRSENTSLKTHLSNIEAKQSMDTLQLKQSCNEKFEEQRRAYEFQIGQLKQQLNEQKIETARLGNLKAIKEAKQQIERREHEKSEVQQMMDQIQNSGSISELQALKQSQISKQIKLSQGEDRMRNQTEQNRMSKQVQQQTSKSNQSDQLIQEWKQFNEDKRTRTSQLANELQVLKNSSSQHTVDNVNKSQAQETDLHSELLHMQNVQSQQKINENKKQDDNTVQIRNLQMEVKQLQNKLVQKDLEIHGLTTQYEAVLSALDQNEHDELVKQKETNAKLAEENIQLKQEVVSRGDDQLQQQKLQDVVKKQQEMIQRMQKQLEKQSEIIQNMKNQQEQQKSQQPKNARVSINQDNQNIAIDSNNVEAVQQQIIKDLESQIVQKNQYIRQLEFKIIDDSISSSQVNEVNQSKVKQMMVENAELKAINMGLIDDMEKMLIQGDTETRKKK